MGRRKADAIDLACRQWADIRRRVLGLDQFDRATEMIGALRSTLGQRRDLHAGSVSVGRVVQHFPEVYTGDALEVNRAFKAMRAPLRDLLDVHYVARGPITLKADALAVSTPTYFRRLGEAKVFVESWLARSVN